MSKKTPEERFKDMAESKIKGFDNFSVLDYIILDREMFDEESKKLDWERIAKFFDLSLWFVKDFAKRYARHLLKDDALIYIRWGGASDYKIQQEIYRPFKII